VCVYTIQLYNNIKDWVVIVYRRREKITAEYVTKRLDLTPEERKTRDRQRANDRQKAYYERRREDEDFKKVRSDR
jgi:hypothetical protein